MRAKCIKSLELDHNFFVEGQFYNFDVQFDYVPNVCRQLTFSIRTDTYLPKAVFYDRYTCKENKYPYCFEDYFVIDDPKVHVKTPYIDAKDFVKIALESNYPPFDRRLGIDKRYKSRSSISVEGTVKSEMGTADDTIKKVTVLTDPFKTDGLKAGDRVQVIIIKKPSQ